MSNGCRVTTAYVPGTRENKPPGCSEVYHGEIVSKSDIGCKLSNSIEKMSNNVLRAAISLRDSSYDIPQELLDLLEWLDQNVYSFGSFCFMKTDAPRHTFSMSTLDTLHNVTMKFQVSVLEKRSDFIRFDDLVCLDLDNIRISVREMESYFIELLESQRISIMLRSLGAFSPDRLEETQVSMNRMSEILNRLSSLLYWATRVVYQNNCASSVKHLEWSGAAKEFVLSGSKVL